MRNFKITLEYDGTAFAGWQIQTAKNRTVQGEIEKALKIIFKKNIRVFGSGRTDAGVHALGQVANFKAATLIPIDKVTSALNANLPDDIAVIESQEVPLHFHAQFDAKQKTYRYIILNRRARTANQKNFCHHVPYKLNLAAMRKEAKAFVGKKDFRSFVATDSLLKADGTEKGTIRTISNFTIRKHGDFIYIEVTANGFLYKMVRNMVGTLIEVGTGTLPAQSIKKILQKKSRLAAGITAKASGLTLVEVKY